MNYTTSMMENLPDELIMMIFSYISALELSLVMSRVCKKWNSIINSRIIRIKRAEHYKKLHKGLQVILVTDAESSIQKSEILISYAIRLTPRLRELTINSDFPLDKNSFKSLSLLVHLRHLDVFAKKQFLNRDTHINQGINSLIINETISSTFLTNLRRNDISSFHMYGRADHFIPREMDCFLNIHAAQLRDLTLRCSEMTDARFRVLTRCVNLLSLQLYMCPLLTKHGIMPIVNLPALQRLHLTGTVLLRSRGLQELIKRLPPLVLDLNLSGSHFDGSHCGALALRLPRLRALELWRCRLERAALFKLARRLPELARLDTDVELKLAQIKELERHPALTRLRCRWKGIVRTTLNLTSSLQVYSGSFLRNSSEGPSAELFYFWTRDTPLPEQSESSLPTLLLEFPCLGFKNIACEQNDYMTPVDSD
ncbi:uncharacterized protein LOC126775374 [Nymphalis io]|uniref:uncharacterized protein LOC126775374 n=1 Tax=Inachis io TaxID=171585 RepID=UPI002167D918|nr:uncharacterized protein LOC126775374 [Nymphalis io]